MVPDLVVMLEDTGWRGAAFSSARSVRRSRSRRSRAGSCRRLRIRGIRFQCAAALANLDVIEEEDFLERAPRTIGELLGRRLAELERRFEIVGEVAESGCSGESDRP